MTTSSGNTSGSTPIDALTLRSPDALVAAVPYLLGFRPVESAVVVWLRAGRIMLTQRLDLPSEEAHLAEWRSALWTHVAADRADEIVVVLVTGRSDLEWIQQAIVTDADARGIAVRDALRLSGDRWWSLLCSDESCCPVAGRQVQSDVAAAVAAEFTMLGQAPLPDRESIEAWLSADPVQVAEVVRRLPAGLPGRGSGPRRRQVWRDRSLELVRECLTQAAPSRRANESPAVLARLLPALADIRVRDTALWDLAQSDSDGLRRAMAVLVQALRAAPEGLVAPVATCVAIVAWQLGDGTRATIAVDRALSDDPGYSLALLVTASLRAGLPPEAWREAMAGLTRDECRYGAGAAAGDPDAEQKESA
jgi:hypothetical protein